MKLSESIDKQLKRLRKSSYNYTNWETGDIEIEDFISTAIKQAILDIVPEENISEGQIYMPKGYNPDRISDIVFCAEHSIIDSYNQCRQELLNRILE